VPHPLKDHPLPGIDPRRLEQLSNAGLASLEDVVDAGPERLSELTGFDLKTCRALVRLSSSALAHHNPDVIELGPLRNEPGSGRLTRGLRIARSIERGLSLVRKARSWASQAPRSEGKHRRKTRRQLRKLLTRLESLQESVLSDGLSQRSHDHLTGELQLFEATLEHLIGASVKRKTLKRVRRLAKALRLSLDTNPQDTRS
jgi:hypothetical protein